MIYENIKVAGPKDYFRIKFKMTAACKKKKKTYWKKIKTALKGIKNLKSAKRS